MKTRLLKLFLLLTFVVLSSGDVFSQVVWEKHEGNPVFSGPVGSWYRHLFQPNVLYNADSLRYEMWFGAGYNYDRPYQIGFATSIDGISWTVYPDPVLTPDPGKWDSFTVEWPFIIRENGIYKMWYAGGELLPTKTGFATSTDGINWDKHINPVFVPGTNFWETDVSAMPSVIRENNGYSMWYTGGNTGFQKLSIGSARSSDGIAWERNINNPLLEPGPEVWDGVWIYSARVLFIDTLYYMWYTGSNAMWGLSQIGLATSSNGTDEWVKYGKNPVLMDSHKIECGSVIFKEDTLKMWYSANNGSLWQIGLAISAPFIPVPVELISFTSTSNGNEVILNWSTATEVNNYGFEVQRSTDYKDFFTVGFVKGNGTTTEQQNYTFSHRNLSNGTNYFRLKQVDYDGSFEYSDVIEVDWRTFDTYLLEQNYPNPFNPSTTIGYGIKEKSNVKITVLNSIGEEVATILNEEKNPGYHKVEFNAGVLPSGVYFYRIATGEYTAMRKMLLIK
jgi:predicted GH43/DUF377 family glycosyl hydrolase